MNGIECVLQQNSGYVKQICFKCYDVCAVIPAAVIEICGLLTYAGGAALCYEVDEQKIDSRVQNRTALKYVKNHTYWFMHFDAGRQTK